MDPSPCSHADIEPSGSSPRCRRSPQSGFGEYQHKHQVELSQIRLPAVGGGRQNLQSPCYKETGGLRSRVKGNVAIVREAIPVPGPGEVLVRVTHAGLCGSDLRLSKARESGWDF